MKNSLRLSIRLSSFVFDVMSYERNFIARDSVASSGATATQSTPATTELVITIQPWVWIVGGVILLIIIIALLTGK